MHKREPNKLRNKSLLMQQSLSLPIWDKQRNLSRTLGVIH